MVEHHRTVGIAGGANLRGDLDRCFTELGRDPDVDAPELRAFDAADHLILTTAAAELEWLSQVADGASEDAGSAEVAGSAERLVIIGDRHGALTVGAARVLGQRGIRTHQDPLLGERALARNTARAGVADAYRSLPLGEELVRDARVVLVQLPRSLAALEELAWWIARYAHPSVRVYAGGRDKHMSRSMNEVLGRAFASITAGRGERKARVLTATGPRADLPSAPPFPVWGEDPDLAFRLAAYGQVFGGATLDHGSRLLLETLASDPPLTAAGSAPRRIVDLGCGNGVLATAAALAFPGAHVIATDQSAAAAAAAALTAQAAGVDERVEVHRADATEAVPPGWADLVLLNPPFHTGATIHSGVGERLIRASAQALRPGGELRLVHNSHLRYRSLIEREIGPVRQLARTRTFTVLAAVRRPAPRVPR